MSRHTRSGAHVAVRPTPRRGFARRHLGAITVIGAVLAVSLPAADAADGDPVLAGRQTEATGATQVSTSNQDGLVGATADNDGQWAGVYGTNTGAGDGVDGYSAHANGVSGTSVVPNGSGVLGRNDEGGYGVIGYIGGGGVAVWANDVSGRGVALRTTGKVQFQQRSNTTTIASGLKSRTVTLPGVTPSSRVLATVQRPGGYFVQAAVPANGSFTIYLNKAAPAPQTVPVGYFVIN